MEKAVVLCLRKKKGTFLNSFDLANDEEYTLITMKEKKSALRKLKKVLINQKVIIGCGDETSFVFNKKLCEYKKLSYRTVIPVTARILKQMAEKHNIILPFDEVCICASPEIIRNLLPSICEMGKMYTLVSPGLSHEEKDSFYYNYGCVIRSAGQIEYPAPASRIIIKANDIKFSSHISSPVLDLSENPASGSNVLKAGDISVYDNRMKALSEKWGGICGLSTYELLEEIPDESTVVNIYQKPDRIFLLDINKI